MATTTNYGSWLNTVGDLGVAYTIGIALGDYEDDYDVDAIKDEYLDAIDAALPNGVFLSGDEFIGPYHEEDQHFDGFPLDDDGELDIAAIVESIDLMAIVEKHELWTIDQVAEHLGYTTASAAGAARKKLSSWGVKAADHRPDQDSGRVKAVYLRREVEAAQQARPGQGSRTDLTETP